MLPGPYPGVVNNAKLVAGPLSSDIVSVDWVPIAREISKAGKCKIAMALTPEAAHLLWMDSNLKWIKRSMVETCTSSAAFTRASVAPDGQTIALACSENHVHCWRIKVESLDDVILSPCATFDTYESPVQCLAWDSASRLLATSDGRDCTVWKINNFESRNEAEVQESNSIICCGPDLSSPIVSMAFQPNGSLLAVVTLSGKVALYNSQKFRCGGLASPVGTGILLEEEPEVAAQLYWENQDSLLAFVPGSYLVRLQCNVPDVGGSRRAQREQSEVEAAKEEVSCPITPSNGVDARSPERSLDLSREMSEGETKKESKSQSLKSAEAPLPHPIRTFKANSPRQAHPSPPPPPLAPSPPPRPLMAHIQHLRHAPSISQGRAVHHEQLAGWGIAYPGYNAGHSGHPSPPHPWMGNALQPSPFAFHPATGGGVHPSPPTGMVMPPMVSITPQPVVGGRPLPVNQYCWPMQGPSPNAGTSWAPMGMATPQQSQQAHQAQYSLQQWAGIAPGYMNYQQGGGMPSSPGEYYPGYYAGMNSGGGSGGGSGGLYTDDHRWVRHQMPQGMHHMSMHGHRDGAMSVSLTASSPSSSARTSSDPSLMGVPSIIDGSSTSAVQVLSPQGSREAGLGTDDTPRSESDVGKSKDISPEEAGALTVYVGNLMPSVDENVLMWTFAQFGPVTHVQVIRDRGTQASRGYGFVTFAHSAYAMLAMQQMHGKVLYGAFGGQRIKVAPTNKSDSES